MFLSLLPVLPHMHARTQGYWHSAPNSAAVHACYVPDACAGPSDLAYLLPTTDARSSTGGSSRSSLNTYPPPPALGSSSTGTGGSSSDGSGSSSSSSSSGVGGVGVNERTQALLACQVALYSSGSPPYGDASAG